MTIPKFRWNFFNLWFKTIKVNNLKDIGLCKVVHGCFNELESFIFMFGQILSKLCRTIFLRTHSRLSLTNLLHGIIDVTDLQLINTYLGSEWLRIVEAIVNLLRICQLAPWLIILIGLTWYSLIGSLVHKVRWFSLFERFLIIWVTNFVALIILGRLINCRVWCLTKILWTFISSLLIIKPIQILIALITDWLAHIMVRLVNIPCWLFKFYLLWSQMIGWRPIAIRMLMVRRVGNMLFVTLRMLRRLVVEWPSAWSLKVHLFLRSSLM